MYYHFIIIFIFYSLYVQLDPSMGNIWLRPDSDGNQVFCPLGLVDLILAPLQKDKAYFWEPTFWSINFFVYIIVYFFIYLLVVKGYNHSFFLTLNEKDHVFQLQ